MIDDPTCDELLAAAGRGLGEFTDPDGRVRFPVTALIATGSPDFAGPAATTPPSSD